MQKEEVQYRGCQFTCQNAPQISMYAKSRYAKEYKENADAKADNILVKAKPCLSKTVQYAGQRGIQIQEGTDKGQNLYEDTCILDTEDQCSYGLTINAE